jgi:hypothetical protein
MQMDAVVVRLRGSDAGTLVYRRHLRGLGVDWSQ